MHFPVSPQTKGEEQYLTIDLESFIDVLRRKFGQIYREFLEMAELDQHSSQPHHSLGFLPAFRSWVFSLMAGRQRRGYVAVVQLGNTGNQFSYLRKS
jgi:hypothetical protein